MGYVPGDISPMLTGLISADHERLEFHTLFPVECSVSVLFGHGNRGENGRRPSKTKH